MEASRRQDMPIVLCPFASIPACELQLMERGIDGETNSVFTLVS